MPKVQYLTTAAGPDGVIHEGTVVNVSKDAAAELIAGGHARSVSASDNVDDGPSENAGGRRGRSRAVSSPDEDA